MTGNQVAGPGGSGPRPVHRHESHPAPASLGEWNGLRVSVSDDPVSLLADAAGDLAPTGGDSDDIDIGKRKKAEKEKRSFRIVAVVPPASAMEQMKKRLADRLAKLLAALLAAGGNPAAFRKALDEAFPDPTDRHFALLWLEEETAGRPSLAALARRERERLEADAAAEIQAGYNVHDVDASAVGGADAGRDAYRRTVLGHADLGELLDDILTRCDRLEFQAAVDYLRRAVAADLGAASPSADKRELESLNNDLYHLRALGNFTREFAAAMAALRENSGKPELPGVGVEALRLLCRAKEERLVMLDPAAVILRLERENDPTYDVRALTLLWRLAHNMPFKLFSDQDSRQRLLDAGQKLLDGAVDLEESLLEEEEDA